MRKIIVTLLFTLCLCTPIYGFTEQDTDNGTVAVGDITISGLTLDEAHDYYTEDPSLGGLGWGCTQCGMPSCDSEHEKGPIAGDYGGALLAHGVYDTSECSSRRKEYYWVDGYTDGDGVWHDGYWDFRIVTYSSSSGSAVGANSWWILFENGNLVIGGTGNTYNFDKDGNNIFCTTSHTDAVTKVYYGAGLANIGTACFANFHNLASFNFCGGLCKLLDDYSFYSDNSLETFICTNGIRSIGKKAFSGTSLSSIYLPRELRIIDTRAFKGLYLVSIDLPNKLKNINTAAFSKNLNLSFINWGKSNVYLGDYAFFKCKLGRRIINYLPKNVIKEGKFIFNNSS